MGRAKEHTHPSGLPSAHTAQVLAKHRAQVPGAMWLVIGLITVQRSRTSGSGLERSHRHKDGTP